MSAEIEGEGNILVTLYYWGVQWRGEEAEECVLYPVKILSMTVNLDKNLQGSLISEHVAERFNNAEKGTKGCTIHGEGTYDNDIRW